MTTVRATQPGVDAELQQAILQSVEDGFEAQLTFTEELVRFPSLRGHEQSAQAQMQSALTERGYEVDRWAIDVDEIKDHPGFSPVAVDYTEMYNVVGTHRPTTETGRSLILNGHIDVVPTGPAEMWTQPPFEPHRDGDWLYGRGSGDMKAGLAANLFAVDALARLGYEPAATLYQQSVVEEECTGNGALACMQRGYRADAVIIPEPEDDMLVRANVGVIWFQVAVAGSPVHVREATSGSNAIEAAHLLMQGLRGLEAEWNDRKNRYPYFEDLEHPINLNFGKIAGGDWASSVPSWCTVDCRISIYPGVAAVDAAAEIEACVARTAAEIPFLAVNPPTITYNGFFAEGYVLEEGSDAEATLGRAHAASYGADLESFVTPGYLDGRVFVLYQDTPCMVYGPYSESIHAFDERVRISSIKRVTGTIALFIAEWCGLEKI